MCLLVRLTHSHLCSPSYDFSPRYSTMTVPQIAVIVGSNRKDSINRQLAQALAKLGAGKFEAKFIRIDDLPLFNQDHEGNLVPEVVRFKDELAKADGVLIVTPEHNRSIPTVLKNAVDWGTRPWGKNNWGGKADRHCGHVARRARCGTGAIASAPSAQRKPRCLSLRR